MLLLSTTRKFCWFTISTIFNISEEVGGVGEGASDGAGAGEVVDEQEAIATIDTADIIPPPPLQPPADIQLYFQHQNISLRQRSKISDKNNVLISNYASELIPETVSSISTMGVVKCCSSNSPTTTTTTTTTFSFTTKDSNLSDHCFENDYLNNNKNQEKNSSNNSTNNNNWSANNRRSRNCCGNGFRKRPGILGSSTFSSLDKKVLNYQDAPSYLQFNPFITGGYRSNLSPRDCVKSLFWWTNETINIWSHLVGWVFFMCLSVYDILGLLDLPTSHPWDQTVITFLLASFQACMLLSSLYHIFCCHSENYYRKWLSADLIGVSLSLLAIYISGIYYAFSCVPFWLNFYLVTVGAIFATAMGMQILPLVSKKDMVTEENFHFRLILFGGWAAYGIVPTVHWAFLHGGMASPAVALLLPRIFWMYVLSATAFLFYVFRIPERFWPGLVNYVGSSHQMWHILIVAAFYHWHNTGLMYLHFRASNPCSEEYAFLFPAEAVQLGVGVQKIHQLIS